VAPDVLNLGIDPLYRIVHTQAPFDECPIAEVGLSLTCREIRVAVTWAHQFYTYLELIQDEYGSDIRRQVQQVILYLLNRYGEAGDQLERLLALTQQAIDRYGKEVAGARGDVGVTLETYLAIALLTKLPDSPYFVGRECEGPDIPYDTLDAFSRCLARGASRVKTYFRREVRPGGCGTANSRRFWGALESAARQPVEKRGLGKRNATN